MEEPAADLPAAGSQAAELITTTLLVISCLLSWYAFYDVGFAGHEARVPMFTFVSFADLHSEWALRIDSLTAVMLVVVTTISSLVHLYSIGYMAEDPYKPRFFCYLSFFTFAMLMLATADNLVQLFFGWEGVGLSSYLLIGFWYHRPEAKRGRDQGLPRQPHRRLRLFAGNFCRFRAHRSGRFRYHLCPGAWPRRQDVPFPQLRRQRADGGLSIAVHGRHGKVCAVFAAHLAAGRHGRPTPVSALIHAATMVTAGVFMVARLSPLFSLSPTASAFVTFIGATTAIFAATVALVQNDIKRIIAYSTCSQLGYMFVAMGVGAYSVGMFHLFTHAFFKALLFLGSGSVIIAMHHEQDIRRMGGLWRKLPFTYGVMLVGTLALTGFPFTAGYFSKDAIIEAAAVSKNPMATYGFIMTVAAAALTSFYSWRLIFKTFHGEPHDRASLRGGAREPGGRCSFRSALLAIGSIAAGWPALAVFTGHGASEFFRESINFGAGNTLLEGAEHLPLARFAGADGDDGRRLLRRLAVLYSPTGYSRGAGARARRALPVSPQQMVFRRDLRFPLRSSRHVARPLAVEGRRRLRHRRLGA